MTTPFDFLNAVAALEKPDGIIAFPTDTVYGLGCFPQNIEAIEKIYRIKNRSTQKPLTLMSNSVESFKPFIGEMTLLQVNRFYELSNKYWPGALTIIVPKNRNIPDIMTKGLNTVGLRVPDCPFLSVLFNMIKGGGLATTSANITKYKECTKASEVFEIFGDKLDFILMNDNFVSGLPSTVVLIKEDGGLTTLREGGIVID